MFGKINGELINNRGSEMKMAANTPCQLQGVAKITDGLELLVTNARFSFGIIEERRVISFSKCAKITFVWIILTYLSFYRQEWILGNFTRSFVNWGLKVLSTLRQGDIQNVLQWLIILSISILLLNVSIFNLCVWESILKMESISISHWFMWVIEKKEYMNHKGISKY